MSLCESVAWAFQARCRVSHNLRMESIQRNSEIWRFRSRCQIGLPTAMPVVTAGTEPIANGR
jgi:hypothetical protein